MQSFKGAATQAMALNNSDVYCQHQSSLYQRGEESRGGARFADLGELEQSTENDFHNDDASLSRSTMYTGMKTANVPVISSNLQFGGHNNSLASAEMFPPGATAVDSSRFTVPKGPMAGIGAGNGYLGNGPFENWADSGVLADNGQQTDTSTDTDDKNQYLGGEHHERLHAEDSMNEASRKGRDQKALRRLAQNREAARKSRMRKKAYVQQLENSRLKLAQLEQELKRARQPGPFLGNGGLGDQCSFSGGNGGSVFDLSYTRWLEEHQHLIGDLRSALNCQSAESELRLHVEGVMSHYDEIFRLKSIGAKSDVFHMLSGMWKTPTERCFMWLGGFRCSEMLKIIGNPIETLTEQQLVGICNLQQSSQQAEDALSQGLEALQLSLLETLSSNSPGFCTSGNVADYMGQMAIAMSKLATLENFLHQADLLRQQTLQQLQRILTTHQAARALLAISDYRARLRALSTLWLARPKE